MSDSSDEAVLDAMADEYLQRRRTGEAVEVEEFAARRPDLAERIRSLLETLCFVHSAAGEHVQHGSSPTPGMRMGDYLLLRELGRGGMGIVYEAEQVPLSRRVALKLLSTAATTAVARQRFLVEARAAARLHHTNIVPVFDTGEADGTAF